MSLVKKNPSNLNRIIKGTKYSEAFMGKPTDENICFSFSMLS